jgi:hypothetical protein
LHVLFLCNENCQKEKDEGKAIPLPASCDAGKNYSNVAEEEIAMQFPTERREMIFCAIPMTEKWPFFLHMMTEKRPFWL